MKLTLFSVLAALSLGMMASASPTSAQKLCCPKDAKYLGYFPETSTFKCELKPFEEGEQPYVCEYYSDGVVVQPSIPPCDAIEDLPTCTNPKA